LKQLLKTVALAAGVAVLTGSAGAGATGAPVKRAIDVSTPAAIKQYLRSIGVSPRGVVIQRGLRNYAGARCPGKRWTCTSTSRPVVQLAAAGGKNSFQCTTASCAVVQVAEAATVTNVARCIRTTGITQACSITQSSTDANNQAIIVEIATKMSGLTQNASQTAQIVQTADTGSNQACVLQKTTIEGSTVAKKGVPVTVTLNAHQSISIAQDSHSGGNTVQGASSSGACASGAVDQSQTITSKATGAMSITQNENATDTGPNMMADVAQNQSTGFFGSAVGQNTALLDQTNTLTAIAVGNGPVSQTQSSTGGGIQAKVNQFSDNPATVLHNTAVVNQTETQCVHAQVSGSPTYPPCPTGGIQPALLDQEQHGPIRKGGCCSVQGDNPEDTFTITQHSTQDSDDGSTQTNTVEADCSTSGNCTATQQTTVDGRTTTITQSGQDVNTSINCTGSTCTTPSETPTITFDGSPGTNPPPATLGPYTMTSFGPDPQPIGATVTGVNDPAGSITFSPTLTHVTVGNGWATWSHGYTGDVYYTTNNPATITIALPAGTNAFYLYAEPNTLSPFTVTATAQDGTTSGPVLVNGDGGASYFGFYGTGGATLASITVTTDDTLGLGIGEFGISPTAAPG
jgi:hypothetical protein